MIKAIIGEVEALLAEEGFTWDEPQRALVTRHQALIREWNEYASLVSMGDLERLEERHVVDALGLGGVIRRVAGDSATLLDVGSGGGFPVIPLKVLMPGLAVTLVERSAKKVGFLRQVVGDLGLVGVEVVHGEFPGAVAASRPAVITARAVEVPKKVFKGLKSFLAGGSVFLWQGGTFPPGVEGMFHVEQVEDAWSRAGLRRGRLAVVTKRPGA